VVVTRYFGGIKLGAGGLIRAYSHAAALGIEAATTLEMTPFAQLDVAVSYEHLATIEHYMRQNEIRSLDADYAEGVTLHLLIPPAEIEKISEDITNLTAGRATLTTSSERLIAIRV
jgi:putative IMPACT (imprinted ancient) family translation regulator